MDALASSERASQWTPAPTPSTAAHPDGLRATGTSTQKSEHGSARAIRAATTLSVGPTSWDAVRERQVVQRQVLRISVTPLYWLLGTNVNFITLRITYYEVNR